MAVHISLQSCTAACWCLQVSTASSLWGNSLTQLCASVCVPVLVHGASCPSSCPRVWLGLGLLLRGVHVLQPSDLLQYIAWMSYWMFLKKKHWWGESKSESWEGGCSSLLSYAFPAALRQAAGCSSTIKSPKCYILEHI